MEVQALLGKVGVVLQMVERTPLPTCHVFLFVQVPAELITLNPHHVTQLQGGSEKNVSGVYIALVVVGLWTILVCVCVCG